VGTRLTTRLVLRGDPERPTRIELEPAPGVEPVGAVVLAANEEKQVELSVEPGKLAPGTRLRLHGEIAGPEAVRVRPRVRGEARREESVALAGPAWSAAVPVAFEPRSAELASSFALGPLEPGSEARAESGLRVTPQVVLELTARLEDARGVSVTASVEREKLVLVARAGAEAAPGRRSGSLELRLKGSSSPPLVRPITVDVVARPELALRLEPATLALKGRYGWAEARLSLAANERVRLSVAPGSLEGQGARITPRRDIRFKAADASWDARTLEPGQPRELLVRVYLGSDLPPGRYEGRVAVTLEGDRREPLSRTLPLAVEVER
jgi:hypothetical protein